MASTGNALGAARVVRVNIGEHVEVAARVHEHGGVLALGVSNGLSEERGVGPLPRFCAGHAEAGGCEGAPVWGARLAAKKQERGAILKNKRGGVVNGVGPRLWGKGNCDARVTIEGRPGPKQGV